MEVIDLLSDEDDVEVGCNRKSEGSDDDLRVLRAVLPHLTDRHLQELVDRAHGNLEQAIEFAFQVPAPATKQPGQPVRRFLNFFDPPSVSHRTASGNDAVQAQSNNETLSNAWHRIAQSLTPPNVWKDPDFPPVSKSIDGRSSQTSIGVVLCSCGYPAASKKVQSDGPNYGRFFLACGRPQKRRAQVIPIHVKDSKRPIRGLDNSEDNLCETTHAKATATIRNPYAKYKHPPTTPEKIKNICEPKASPSPQRRNCNFFQWDDKNGATNQEYVTHGSKFIWKHFNSSQGHVLYQRQFSHASVRQGAVGNCWFLSALAVVAEKPHLIQKIVPHRELTSSGCYQINLFLDGCWTPVFVDAYLPTVVSSRTKLIPSTAFCDVLEGQLWAALVEKAYAKAHGSYQQLSGGFIQEALQDLTGAPTETIIFQPGLLDRDEFWARLESFASAGFLMGVATSQGGDGLVGMHAYSVLEVLTLDNCAVGQQSKVTEFFGPSKRPRIVEKSTIRLVRIRNPWGKREWKGAWSANSEQWTTSIRSRLGTASTYAQGDGTFYISYNDMLQRFHHLDVAKTREAWVHSVYDGIFISGSDPLASSRYAYFFKSPDHTISATLSLIQPKKRAHIDSSFWYCDPSFILLKKRNRGPWERAACAVSGILRQSHVDIMVEKDTEYCCIPFSCVTSSPQSSNFSFRLVMYSSSRIVCVTKENIDTKLQEICLEAFHQNQLSMDLKLLYPIQPKTLLVCVHGASCICFFAINGYTDCFFSIKLILDLPKGLLKTFGSEESDLPPQTQSLCLVVSTNGRQSAATVFAFRYLSTLTEVENLHQSKGYHQFGSKLQLSVSGDLLIRSIDPRSCRTAGGDKVDTYMWIPQIGAAFG